MEGFSRRTTADSRASLAPADSDPAAVREGSGPVAPPTGSADGTDTSTDDSAWAKKFLLSLGTFETELGNILLITRRRRRHQGAFQPFYLERIDGANPNDRAGR